VAGVEVLRVEWRRVDGCTVAVLVGDVDMGAAEVVIGILRVAELAPRIVVDLSRVTFLDNAGLDLVRTLAALPNITVDQRSPAVDKLLANLGIEEL
jgi:anti-anti-sigma regulatory factor